MPRHNAPHRLPDFRNVRSSHFEVWLRTGVIGLMLALSGFLVPRAGGQGLTASELDLERWSSGRLGSTLTGLSRDLTGGSTILPQQLTLALGLAELATELDPESADPWYRLLDIATVMKDEDPDAAKAARRAVETIVRLRPDDSVSRLRLLLDRVDSRDTAEGRVEAYETLLMPDNVERLGSLAASRLAFDLAVLQLRIGNLDEAAVWLIEAVNLDPSYPQAAEMLAGLLRTTSTTPAEEAELLAIAFTASPLDGVLARRLGQLVLAEGAYATAADILNLALILTRDDARFRDELVGDEALALWGEDRSEEALELLDAAARNRQARIRARWVARGITREAARARPVLPAPSLALIEAVIVARTSSTFERMQAIEQLFKAFEFQFQQLAELRELSLDDTTLEESARKRRLDDVASRTRNLTVDEAWARAWFGWTPASADGASTAASLSDLLDDATGSGSIDSDQRLVIEGWWALNQDDYDLARSLLAPASEGSPYAAAGLALLEELTGENKSAARLYLDTYRKVPGQLIGLWSRSRLSDLLDRRIPEPESAEAMTAIIKDTLPDAVGRALRDPKHGVLSVQIQPASLRNPAFDELEVELRITNVSGLDLAIGPDGPIQPSVALVADAVDFPIDESRLKPGLSFPFAPTLVIPIDRRFRLDSQRELVIPIDLTATAFNRVLAVQSTLSGTIRLRAVVNYVAAPNGAIDVGLFGREGRSPVFRTDGLLPVDEDAASRMLETVRDPRTIQSARDIAAMLTLAFAGPDLFPGSSTELEPRAVEACLALPPVARAWVMSVVPAGDFVPQRLIDALVDDDGVGLAIAVARFSPSPTSAAVLRALESDDPRIRRMAVAARDLALRMEAAAEAEFRLDTD